MKRLTSQRFEAFLKEGRGMGRGADYKPWINANRASSKGYSFSVTGRTTGRRHQLLSGWEFGTFQIVDRRRDVIDIREQFPLLPLHVPVALAKNLGLRAPRPREGGIHVMTTDFLIDMADGSRLAVAVKPFTTLLERKRTREILAIEQAYWAALNVPFQVVTDKEITQDMIYNLDAIYSFRDAPSVLDHKGIGECAARLRESLHGPGRLSLAAVCQNLDKTSGLPGATHLGVLLHLLWRGDLQIDLRRRLFPLERYLIAADVLTPVEESGR
jgi:hypothetical protein